MVSVVIFGFVLFVAGGFIAWLGDRLGTYVGRKRISKFGLRPRHTAMLYTIFSGSVIALTTLLLLMAVNSSFSTALLKGRQLVNNNKTLQRQNANLAAANGSLESRIAEKTAMARDAQSRLQAALYEEIQVKNQFADVKKHLDMTRGELTLSEQAVAQNRIALGDAKTQLGITERNLRDAQWQRRQAERDVASKRQDLVIANRNIAIAGKAYDDAQDEVSRLSAESARLKALNGKLADANAGWLKLGARLATEGPIFRKGQDIDRIQIATNQSKEAIKTDIVKWLDNLSMKADSAGSAQGANGRAVVVEADMLVDPTGQTPLPNEDENIEALAESIADERGVVDSVVVIAEAHYNTLKGEQARIVVHPYANVLCFSKDEVIASCVVDGTEAPETILNKLSSFLRNKVRPIAASAGIIPTYDPQTGERAYGELNDDSSVVNQIQQIGAGAVVTVVADADTRAIGPLHLRLVANHPKMAHADGASISSSGALTIAKPLNRAVGDAQ